MEYRKLGRTDINVSSICLGTMTWGEQNTEAEAHEQLDYSMEQGVNFIDTAELYAVPTKAETPVSYTHLRAHETPEHLVCRLLLEKKKKKNN